MHIFPPLDPELIRTEIPIAMGVARRWILWRAIPNGEKKPQKIPYYINGKPRGETDTPEDRAQMVTLEEVLQAYQEKGIYSGIGFCLGPDADDSEICWQGIDLDNTTEKSELFALIEELPGYVEKSPSGNGYHAIGRGERFEVLGSNKTGIEAYCGHRYFAVTGQSLGQGNPEQDLAPFIRDVLLLKHGSTKGPSADTTEKYRIPVSQFLELRQALSYLDADDYHNWIEIGMALHASGAGNQAFGLWDEWSKKSEKYEAQAMRKKWLSFHANKKNGLSLESIFGLAQAKGWVNPASRAAVEFERKYGISIEEANRIPVYDINALPRGNTEPFPLLELNLLTTWLEKFAYVAYPAVSQHATLAFTALCASRLYVTEFDDPCALYLGVAARSMSEIRYAHHGVQQAMETTGLRRMLRASRLTNPSQIYKTLTASPACLYLADDYGSVSAFAKRQPSGVQEHALSLLSQIYFGRNLALDAPEEFGLKSEDQQSVIVSPTVSILGLVGWDHLITVLRASEIGRGATEQMLFALGHPEIGIPQDPHPTATPDWLNVKVRQIRGLPAVGEIDTKTIFQNNPGLNHVPIKVRFTEALEPHYQRLDAITSNPKVKSVLLAARGTLRRMAAIIAVWRDHRSPVVDQIILDWASNYVVARLTDLMEQFEILHSEEEKRSAYDYVLARITEARGEGMSTRELIHSCKSYRNLDKEQREKLVSLMIADGIIVEVETKGKNGQKGRRLFADKFVSKKQ